jgi:hypothetical protein
MISIWQIFEVNDGWGKMSSGLLSLSALRCTVREGACANRNARTSDS